MSKPHKCPTCAGTQQVQGRPCKTCKGSGVVWEPGTDESAEESAIDKGRTALDITDYGPDA